ncbi:SidA/IucD/PvdA family monooxygenase, partial [Bacillus altitudinis]|uniref:SidA/IucD/PvdA family monooxygenase n=1 Tax=Bacillus altitudinis TaxID=293387 RepID=UPI0011A329C7
HTNPYLHQQKQLHQPQTLPLVPSPHTPPQIFLHLLHHHNKPNHLSSFTPSTQFTQLHTPHLPHHLFTPNYLQYFHSLPYQQPMNTFPT